MAGRVWQVRRQINDKRYHLPYISRHDKSTSTYSILYPPVVHDHFTSTLRYHCTLYICFFCLAILPTTARTRPYIFLIPCAHDSEHSNVGCEPRARGQGLIFTNEESKAGSHLPIYLNLHSGERERGLLTYFHGKAQKSVLKNGTEKRGCRPKMRAIYLHTYYLSREARGGNTHLYQHGCSGVARCLFACCFCVILFLFSLSGVFGRIGPA